MHPAFSVIAFTTLSGAGYGLLLWACSLILLPHLQGRAPAPGAAPLLLWLVLLVLGLALTTAGLVSSVFHLGKPQRAWRAFSQWRTSWLSREGVLAVLTALAVLALLGLLAAALLGHGSAAGPAVPALASVVALLSLATVASTAMIYASLKPVPAWRHRLVLPVYVMFALLSGWMVLMAVTNWAALSDEALGVIVLVSFALAFAAAVLKLLYWRAVDRPLALTRGDAVGLPDRDVSVFERPNTQDNYVNREMGHVLARKHARVLRLIALLLFAVVPALASWLAWALPEAGGPVFTVAALLTLLGVLVERWLFFAQARHVVTLYY